MLKKKKKGKKYTQAKVEKHKINWGQHISSWQDFWEAGRGYSLVVMHGLLTAVASLWQRTSSRCAGFSRLVHGLGCSMACGILLDQDQTSAPCIAQWILNLSNTREAPSIYNENEQGIEIHQNALVVSSLENFTLTTSRGKWIHSRGSTPFSLEGL